MDVKDPMVSLMKSGRAIASINNEFQIRPQLLRQMSGRVSRFMKDLGQCTFAKKLVGPKSDEWWMMNGVN